MASPFEDRLATMLKDNEGLPRLASPLVIGDEAHITGWNPVAEEKRPEPRGSLCKFDIYEERVSGWNFFSHPFLKPKSPPKMKDWTSQRPDETFGNSPMASASVGGLYSTPNVQSFWSFE
ncbi:hypothetical protein H5410_045577 [Solanum commersonii]|uniref:Uncharacterized protein n=1 Tax=Solanum commersonii TaxID=4109 RepID=A0A9J5XC13_SOLCO|nr:hypothetical protein H5410_045577 [Solanum commersonii]